MKTQTLGAALLAATLATNAVAQDVTQVPIRTHFSQGEPQVVAGAEAIMLTGTDAVFLSFDTTGLVPGNVHTLLIAVMNKPLACETFPCTPKDVLMRADIVSSDVGFGGGAIADEEGRARFAIHQKAGQMLKPFFGNGLTELEGVEIHLVLNDHGPLIEGRAEEMLSTYRGGCSEESIPKPMPQTARDQGAPGPNSCRMVQYAQFIPERPAS